jgi:hypothetical protein
VFLISKIVASFRAPVAAAGAVRGTGEVGSNAAGLGLLEVQELAAFSVFAESVEFEVMADFGFVELVEFLLAAEFLLVVSKGALAYHRVTAWLKGQNPCSYQYRHRCIKQELLRFCTWFGSRRSFVKKWLKLCCSSCGGGYSNKIYCTVYNYNEATRNSNRRSLHLRTTTPVHPPDPSGLNPNFLPACFAVVDG